MGWEHSEILLTFIKLSFVNKIFVVPFLSGRLRQVLLYLYLQVSMSREGTTVDGECHKRTASHIRTKHKYDPEIPICDFYEVNKYPIRSN